MRTAGVARSGIHRKPAMPTPGFTNKLAAAGVRISMDGRGSWLDNVFVSRLWRSRKSEEVHVKACANGLKACIGIGQWFRF